MQELKIHIPFDAHVHLRKKLMLQLVAAYTARQFGGAFIMPNCEPKILTTADAIEYKTEIMSALAADVNFVARIAAYLTDTTNPDDIVRGFQDGHIAGVKFYPLGATTGSNAGISSVKNIAHVLKAMESVCLPLHIHGETIKNADGEKLNPFFGKTEGYFLNHELKEIMEIAPNLPIFLEHISLAEQMQFVAMHENIRGTITPMHLGFDQTSYLDVNGKRMWDARKMCLPVLKDRDEVDVMWDWLKKYPHKFAAGTDTAPHDDVHKISLDAGCCSGCFVAPSAVELYTTLFEEQSALGILEQFLTNGWLFQNLTIPKETITLVKKDFVVPARIKKMGVSVTPLGSGDTLPWTLAVPANELALQEM